PAELANKILSGEKLAEKELLDSLKPKPKSDYEIALELLDQIDKAQELLDEQLAHQPPEPTDLRAKLNKIKQGESSPGQAQEEQAETLSQKLERLKQSKRTTEPQP